MELSRELDVPPVAAFRALLTARGWSKLKIKTVRIPYLLLICFGGCGGEEGQFLYLVTNCESYHKALGAVDQCAELSKR